MQPIRVLIVDDSAVVRKILRDHLERSVSFEVVDVARDGASALQKIEKDQAEDGPQRIQAVILDDVMPVMTGKEMLRSIKGRFPRVAVVLFSANVGEGAEGTLDALFHGADDALRKPSGKDGMAKVLRELDGKLRDAVRRHAALMPKGPARPIPGRGPSAQRPAVPPRTSRPTRAAQPERAPAEEVRDTPRVEERRHPVAHIERRGKKYLALVIGSSTGGPEALSRVLEELPVNLAVPILIAQHMPAEFTGRLATRLDRTCHLRVKEAQSGETPRPGTVYVAPGDFHLAVNTQGAGFVLQLTKGPRVNSCRPAADVLFASAAEAYGASLACVVLTGMGSDGLDGARHIKGKGGNVLVQDEETSVVWGMPGYIAREGLADAVLPIDQIGPEIAALVGTSGVVSGAPGTTARAVS